jgi:D-beta-D-heptose 7-phosphate kinase/D-beta-D-heptose 1-phosphate adenosyltransferase
MSVHKIVLPGELSSYTDRLRETGARIVFTNGVFDLLHPGHILYLSKASERGTHLIVAVNSDESTIRLKGPQRPLIGLQARMEVLAALSFVSAVTYFEEDTPLQAIQAARPHVLVKGGDWTPDKIVGREFVESYGGSVLSIPFVSGYSTTSLIEKIRKLPRS